MGHSYDIKQQCKVMFRLAPCHRFPASPDPKVFAAQQTLVEAWSIIEDAYVDAQFGGHQWEDELSNALVATYAAEDGDGAYKQIGNMLSKLGDPFTRIVPASYVSLSYVVCPRPLYRMHTAASLLSAALTQATFTAHSCRCLLIQSQIACLEY